MKKTLTLILIFSTLYIVKVAVAQNNLNESISARSAQKSGIMINIDKTSPPLKANADGRAFWQWEFTRRDANHMRVEFQPIGFDNQNSSVSLSFWDQSGRLVRKLTSQEIINGRSQWSDGIEGDYVLVTLRVKNPGPDTKVKIKRIAVQNETSAPLSIIGDDDSEDIIQYKDDLLIWELQAPIARLLLIQDDLPAWCTGFMVSENTLLTNHHCVKSQTECNDLKVQFNYHVSELGSKSEISQYSCKKFNPDFASATLDYAFIQLEGAPGKTFGKIQLKKPENNSQKISNDTKLLIIQHPAGEPKKITKTNCTVGNIPVDGIISNSDLSHTCDTRGGSSGSPVFDTQGTLVALHHYGFAEGGNWSENRAVVMEQILDDLQKKKVSISGLNTNLTETTIDQQ